MIIYHDLFGLLPEKQGCFNIYKSINAIHPINELKDRNHTFVSTEDGMAFDKNLHLLIIKVFKKIILVEICFPPFSVTLTIGCHSPDHVVLCPLY